MRKIISFKGIARGGDNMTSPEGECLDIINMRMKDGVLVPVPRPETVARLEYPYSKVFWHEMASHYICVTDDSDATLHIYDKEWNAVVNDNGEKVLFRDLKDVDGIGFLGYVVCCFTGKGIFYILFNDGKYRWLGERPPMPSLEITAESRLKRLITEQKYHSTSTAKFESTWRCNSKGYYDECISALNKDGCYVDRALFRFALRLYDGSYISISPMIYVSDEESINGVARDTRNFYSKAYTNESPSTYDVAVLGFKPEFTFSNVDLGAWENIVMGIDLFTTGSIMGKKVTEVSGMYYDGDSSSRVFKKYDTYQNKTLDELWNDVVSAGHFFKIAEYNLKGELVDRLEDVSQSNLVLQQSLSDESASLKSVSAGCSYMFNNRLHIGSLKEWFFKGYDSFFLSSAYGNKETLECLFIRTSIKTSAGTSSVIRQYDNLPLVMNDGVYELPPLLSYPDARAFEMTLYAYVDTELFCKTFELVPHRNLDIAIYLNKWYLGLRVSVKASLSNGVTPAENCDKDVAGMFSNVAGVHTITFSKSAGSWMYNGAAFPGEKYSGLRLVSKTADLADGDSITYTLTACDREESYSEICNIPIDGSWKLLGGGVDETEMNPYEEKKNVLKVSAVDNPFSFPPEYTYAPSQGEVLALASNTVALSQGQFGQHPLYIFCSDGIWANSVDTSGAGAYLASFPLSREVCVNPASVCGIDNGVVFVSRQGVILASGGKMVRLSECIERSDDALFPIYSDTVVSRLVSMMQLGGAGDRHGFTDFMRDCNVVYMPAQSEILFSNARFDFCYLYSLRNGMWSRILLRVKDTVRSYSFVELVVECGADRTVCRIGDACSGDNSVMLITRPQLWGSKLPKRIMQLMLHAYAEPCAEKAKSMPSLACYLFGSNDGVHFKLVAGRESESKVQDLKFPYFPTQAYKYYLFAVCGGMSGESMITALELEIQPAWGNRMR